MNLELIESFSEFKNIDNASMQQILKNVFLSMLKKKFNTDENIDVIVNIKKGDIQIFINKEVVPDGEVEDENREISYSDSIKIDPDFSIGEEVSEEFNFNDFGRRSILQIRQNLISSIMDIQKDNLYNTYKKRIGDIITGEVIGVWRNETIISDDSGNELSLPKSEQISSDFFKRGDIVTSIISRVDFVNNKPVVILSRTSTEFLKKLLTLHMNAHLPT